MHLAFLLLVLLTHCVTHCVSATHVWSWPKTAGRLRSAVAQQLQAFEHSMLVFGFNYISVTSVKFLHRQQVGNDEYTHALVVMYALRSERTTCMAGCLARHLLM